MTQSVGAAGPCQRPTYDVAFAERITAVDQNRLVIPQDTAATTVSICTCTAIMRSLTSQCAPRQGVVQVTCTKVQPFSLLACDT